MKGWFGKAVEFVEYQIAMHPRIALIIIAVLGAIVLFSGLGSFSGGDWSVDKMLSGY